MYGDCEICVTDNTKFTNRARAEIHTFMGGVTISACGDCHNKLVETVAGSAEFAAQAHLEADLRILYARLSGRDDKVIEDSIHAAVKALDAHTYGPMRSRVLKAIADLRATKSAAVVVGRNET